MWKSSRWHWLCSVRSRLQITKEASKLCSVLDCCFMSARGQWRWRMTMKTPQCFFESLILVWKGLTKLSRLSMRWVGNCHCQRRHQRRKSWIVVPKDKRMELVRRSLQWKDVLLTPLFQLHPLASPLTLRKVMTISPKLLEASGSTRNFRVLTKNKAIHRKFAGFEA